MKIHQHDEFFKTRVRKRERRLLNLGKTDSLEVRGKTIARLFKPLRNIKKNDAPFFIPYWGHSWTQHLDSGLARKLLPCCRKTDSRAFFSISDSYILLSYRMINAPAQLLVSNVLQLVEFSKRLMRASRGTAMRTAEGNRRVDERHQYPGQYGLILNPHVYNLRYRWIYVQN